MHEQDITVINRDDLKEGDLFVHTFTSKGITVYSLDSAYYRKAYYRAGRVKKVAMWAFKE